MFTAEKSSAQLHVASEIVTQNHSSIFGADRRAYAVYSIGQGGIYPGKIEHFFFGKDSTLRTNNIRTYTDRLQLNRVAMLAKTPNCSQSTLLPPNSEHCLPFECDYFVGQYKQNGF